MHFRYNYGGLIQKVKHMNNPEAILFDFDYTLADSSQGVFDCANYALRAISLPEKPFSEVSRTIGLSLSETLFRLTGNNNEKSVEVFRQKFVERAEQVMTEKTRLFDGVAPVMEYLRNQHVKTGIVSTKFRYRIADILERHSCLGYFDVIVGGEDVSSVKPNPEGIFKALDMLEIAKKRCVYLGDSLTDAETAERAQIGFIAVLSGPTTRDEFKEYSPIGMIHSITYLPRLLFGEG